MSTVPFEHAAHEARHVCASWFCRLDVESAAIGAHSFAEGIVYVAPTENGAANLLSRLVGWLTDPHHLPESALWPPPFEALATLPANADPDGIAWCVRRYRLSRQVYESVSTLAEELVADEDFQQAVSLVARGLMAAPSLDREGLEILRQASPFADKPEEAAA